MDTPFLVPGRTVTRIDTSVNLGPNAQVDNSTLIFSPENPALTDPFLILGEEQFSSPGFQWHPHRGMETVTTVLDGVLEHGDNHDNAGILQAGDVQWMTAGRGIVHRELAYRDEHAHILQLWINLPAERKMTESRYQDLAASTRPLVTRPGITLNVISGTVEGVTGPALNHVDVQAVMATIEPKTTHAYTLPARHRALVHVLSGRATVAGRDISAGQTAWSDPLTPLTGESVMTLTSPDSDHTTQLMIYSATPIGEPIAFGGPFVMNHRSEIQQAYSDFHTGKFGPIPRQARLAYRQ
jgi:redox-sensitive bicupin YhaK (pirin superfamily)